MRRENEQRTRVDGCLHGLSTLLPLVGRVLGTLGLRKGDLVVLRSLERVGLPLLELNQSGRVELVVLAVEAKADEHSESVMTRR